MATSTQTSHSHMRPVLALKTAGVKASKRKGQNFLVEPAIAARIVQACDLRPGDTVIEIGPGLGILSECIAATGANVRLRMVEFDSRLAAALKIQFAAVSNAEVIEADALKLDLRTLMDGRPVTIVGNLPFNIASALLREFREYSRDVSRMVLMFQREVAERIRARPGSRTYGALSVFTALYWEIHGHFRVSAGSFHPKPKVDAEVITLIPRAKLEFERTEENHVLELIRAGFASRRKTARNSIAAFLGITSFAAETALLKASIDPAARAERLAASDFIRLARALKAPGAARAGQPANA